MTIFVASVLAMFSATKGQRGCSHSKGRWRQHVNGEHGNVDSKISTRAPAWSSRHPSSVATGRVWKAFPIRPQRTVSRLRAAKRPLLLQLGMVWPGRTPMSASRSVAVNTRPSSACRS